MSAGELDLIPEAEEGKGEGWSEEVPANKGSRSSKAGPRSGPGMKSGPNSQLFPPMRLRPSPLKVLEQDS